MIDELVKRVEDFILEYKVKSLKALVKGDYEAAKVYQVKVKRWENYLKRLTI